MTTYFKIVQTLLLKRIFIFECGLSQAAFKKKREKKTSVTTMPIIKGSVHRGSLAPLCKI